MMSKSIAMPMSRARNADIACPNCMMYLRSSLSANAPPKRDSASSGTANPELTSPSRSGEDVRSYAR